MISKGMLLEKHFALMHFARSASPAYGVTAGGLSVD